MRGPTSPNAHRRRRPQPGRGDRHHSIGELHDLGRDAVADREADHACSACDRAGGRAPRPSRPGASAPVAWAMSPTTVIEPLSERRVAILSCIGVRSWTSSITMCPKVRISSASFGLPLLRRLGPEHLAGVVEQGDVGRRPAHVVDRVGPWAVERLVLGVVEHAVGSQPQQAHRPEQVVQQLGRRQHRPHAIERRTDLRDRPHLVANLAGRHLVAAPRRRHRRPHLALDPAAGRVVATEAAARLLDDPDGVVGTQAARIPIGTGRRRLLEADARGRGWRCRPRRSCGRRP